ncbi:MAG: 23S rRNA (pseudouridine(1915)-N(3))-methyltransferase RlmH [Pseudomonadota bacterium]
MDLLIAAIGLLTRGPEYELVEDYAKRTTRAGRPIGLGPLHLTEISGRRIKTVTDQSARLWQASEGALRIVLDERGRQFSSADFATRLADWRDRGQSRAAFLIGGASGHDASLRERADLLLSFGPMVWPHALARVMLAEQIYRAVSILAGTPYHKA